MRANNLIGKRALKQQLQDECCGRMLKDAVTYRVVVDHEVDKAVAQVAHTVKEH